MTDPHILKKKVISKDRNITGIDNGSIVVNIKSDLT